MISTKSPSRRIEKKVELKRRELDFSIPTTSRGKTDITIRITFNSNEENTQTVGCGKINFKKQADRNFYRKINSVIGGK